MTIEYKYPQLLKVNLNQDLMTAEYNTMIPALGIVLLRRISSRIFEAHEEETVPYESVAIIVTALKQCNEEFDTAIKEYSNV